MLCENSIFPIKIVIRKSDIQFIKNDFHFIKKLIK